MPSPDTTLKWSSLRGRLARRNLRRFYGLFSALGAAGLAVLLSGTVHGQVASGSAPSVTATPLSPKPNVLGPNDCIQVRVYQEDDLETKDVINQDGVVTLPLLGPVGVGGKTPEEASALIRDLYGKDYLVDPQVSVTVVEQAKRRFTVLGQVQRPGTYEFPVNEPLNLLQGVAMAGGYTRLGSPSKVNLRRLQNGQPVVFSLNAEQMSKDRKSKPFEILPDDIITVGERIF